MLSLKVSLVRDYLATFKKYCKIKVTKVWYDEWWSFLNEKSTFLHWFFNTDNKFAFNWVFNNSMEIFFNFQEINQRMIKVFSELFFSLFFRLFTLSSFSMWFIFTFYKWRNLPKMLKLLFLGLKREKMILKTFLHSNICGISWSNYSSKLLIVRTVSSVSIISLTNET